MLHNLLAAVATAALLVSNSAFPASADPSPQQSNLAQVIGRYGGTQTSFNTVSWNNGAITLHIADDTASPTAITDCPSGRYCVFQKASFQGSVLSFSTCPQSHTDFSALGGMVGSAVNKRTTGTVRLYANSTTKATLLPGQSAAFLTGITKLTCS